MHCKTPDVDGFGLASSPSCRSCTRSRAAGPYPKPGRGERPQEILGRSRGPSARPRL